MKKFKLIDVYYTNSTRNVSFRVERKNYKKEVYIMDCNYFERELKHIIDDKNKWKKTWKGHFEVK